MKNIINTYFKRFGIEQRPMAASPESFEFCLNVLNEYSVDNILDAGSVLSSAIFHHQNSHKVTTIDDNDYWSQQTKDFLMSELNKDIEVLKIQDVIDEKFDFIFYDYGNIETRIRYFMPILKMTKKFLYLDDMHIQYYREYVITKSKGHNITLLLDSCDEFGRYGAILVKK